jgi:hypothetical protein
MLVAGSATLPDARPDPGRKKKTPADLTATPPARVSHACNLLASGRPDRIRGRPEPQRVIAGTVLDRLRVGEEHLLGGL